MLDFLFPRLCVVCDNRLTTDEKHICCGCLRSLPRTNYHLMSVSPLEQLFWGQVPIVRATSLFFYNSIASRKIVYQLKYHASPKVGKYIAGVLADEIAASGFFNDIDIIVPIPLARKKIFLRGYNQCDWIAEGINRLTGIPIVNNAVKRTKNNPSQTRKTHDERWSNVEDIFRLNKNKADAIRGKHLLIIDDVITTGATCISCMKELMKAGDVRFSVISLAKAGDKTLNKPLERMF